MVRGLARISEEATMMRRASPARMDEWLEANAVSLQPMKYRGPDVKSTLYDCIIRYFGHVKSKPKTIRSNQHDLTLRVRMSMLCSRHSIRYGHTRVANLRPRSSWRIASAGFHASLDTRRPYAVEAVEASQNNPVTESAGSLSCMWWLK